MRHRDSVSFSVATLDEAERIEPGITKIAKEARQNLLWGLADVDEVSIGFASCVTSCALVSYRKPQHHWLYSPCSIFSAES